MATPWWERLREARSRRDEAGELAQRRDELEAELRALAERVEECDARLARERKDVERLRGLSWSAMLHALLGSAERKLRDEEREVVEAQFHKEAAEDDLTRARDEAADVERRLADLGGLDDAEAAYERSLAEAEQHALREKGSDGAELRTLAKRAGRLAGVARRLDRALAKGDAAIAALSAVRDTLGRAEQWSVMDLFGGGVVSSLVKHDKINAARRKLTEARRDLTAFEKHVERLLDDTEIELKFDGFVRFADSFVDNLYHDFIVAQRLSTAQYSVRKALTRIKEQVQRLRTRRDAIAAQLDENGNARRELLERRA